MKGWVRWRSVTRPARFGGRRGLLAAAFCCSLHLLAACSAAPDDPAALTADEDRQLNAAAAQLDAAQNAAPDTAAANESPAP